MGQPAYEQSGAIRCYSYLKKWFMAQYRLKRAYGPASTDYGSKVYIDRLWPQGLSHETFHYDVWDKDITPSMELCEWFHADPDNRCPGFKTRYAGELEENPSSKVLHRLLEHKSVVILLYSSHDEQHDNAVVVYELLTKLAISAHATNLENVPDYSDAKFIGSIYETCMRHVRN